MIDCLIKGKKIVPYVLIIFVAVCFGLLTAYFPLCSDDFSYMRISGQGTRVESVLDVITSQIHHWLHWGGRVWSLGLAQYFLMYDKVVFNVANILCYAVCTYFCVHVVSAKVRPWRWLCVMLLMWMVMPHPGSTIFWVTGAVVYLWAACINVLFVCFLLKENRMYGCLALAMSLPAGNANEAMALGLIVSLGLYFMLTRSKRIIHHVGLILYGIGAGLNIIAPGNFVRMEVRGMSEVRPMALILTEFYEQLKYIFTTVLFTGDEGVKIAYALFFALLIVACMCWKHFRERWYVLFVSLLVGAMVIMCFNLYVKAIYPRALFPFCFIVFLSACVAACGVFDNGVLSRRWNRLVAIILFAVAGGWSVVEIPAAYASISALRQMQIKTQNAVQQGVNIVIRDEQYERSDTRYQERCCMSSDVLGNRQYVSHFGGKDYSVLTAEQAQLIQRIESKLCSMNNAQMITVDGWRVYCMVDRPKSVSIHEPPRETPYKIRFMREISHKMKRKVGQFTVRIGQRYYALWQSNEPCCILTIQYMDKRKEEKKITLERV